MQETVLESEKASRPVGQKWREKKLDETVVEKVQQFSVSSLLILVNSISRSHNYVNCSVYILSREGGNLIFFK